MTKILTKTGFIFFHAYVIWPISSNWERASLALFYKVIAALWCRWIIDDSPCFGTTWCIVPNDFTIRKNLLKQGIKVVWFSDRLCCTKKKIVIITSALITCWSSCVALSFGLRKIFKFPRFFYASTHSLCDSSLIRCWSNVKFFIAGDTKKIIDITWNSTNWIDFYLTVVKFNFIFGSPTLPSLYFRRHFDMAKININSRQLDTSLWLPLLKNPGFHSLDLPGLILF